MKDRISEFDLISWLNNINGGAPAFAYGSESPRMPVYRNPLAGFSANSGPPPGSAMSPTGGGAPTAAPASFSWRNPYAYTSWSDSAGFGDYLGKNMGLFGAAGGLALDAFGAWQGYQQLGLARDALKQEKKAFNINLTNQTQAYNTQMKDRIMGRSYATEADRLAALSEATLTDYSKYGKKKQKDEEGG